MISPLWITGFFDINVGVISGGLLFRIGFREVPEGAGGCDHEFVLITGTGCRICDGNRELP
jgi:hypothetical protein